MGYDVKNFQGSPDSLDRSGRNKEIMHMPGDEGTCPQDEDKQGESHPSGVPAFLNGPGGLDPSVGASDAMHRPGEEGSAGPSGEYRQGNRDVPQHAVPGEFLQGPDVRKTRVAPSRGDDAPKMPGA